MPFALPCRQPDLLVRIAGMAHRGGRGRPVPTDRSETGRLHSTTHVDVGLELPVEPTTLLWFDSTRRPAWLPAR
jgi:hypothetical protein